MRYLLDRLHTELLTLLPYPNNDSIYIGPKGKSTIVTTIFGGILQNEVRCLVCGMESKKHDPFLGKENVMQSSIDSDRDCCVLLERNKDFFSCWTIFSL